MDEVNLRKLVIMRHAERVDFTFGDWIPPCFDQKGNYIRRNLNMPLSVPKRAGSPKTFFMDCPLTQIGLYQATLTGDAMKASNMRFDHVFCSPSLRCIETCNNVLKASNQTHLNINIEPGLFEWCGWYRTNGMPAWLTEPEFCSEGFNISTDYKPVINAVSLNVSESCEEFYMRSFLLTSKLLETYPGDLLFVGHAATLDTCSRQLTGRAPRSVAELLSLVLKVPYASVCVVEEKSDKTWELVNPPFPPLKHADNAGLNWNVFLN